MPGCQAVGLPVPEPLVPQLPGYWVVVAEAGHNCGWLNMWLVKLWRQAQLYICHGTSFPLAEGLGTSPYLPRYLSDRSHDLWAVYIAQPLWVVVTEAGHNCGWLNMWLVKLWRQ